MHPESFAGHQVAEVYRATNADPMTAIVTGDAGPYVLLCTVCGVTAPPQIVICHPDDEVRARTLVHLQHPYAEWILNPTVPERGKVIVASGVTRLDEQPCTGVPAWARPMTPTQVSAWAAWKAADRIAAQIRRPGPPFLFIGGIGT